MYTHIHVTIYCIFYMYMYLQCLQYMCMCVGMYVLLYIPLITLCLSLIIYMTTS